MCPFVLDAPWRTHPPITFTLDRETTTIMVREVLLPRSLDLPYLTLKLHQTLHQHLSTARATLTTLVVPDE
eukprot:3680694-Prorocentrum_lima.AAC.1